MSNINAHSLFLCISVGTIAYVPTVQDQNKFIHNNLSPNEIVSYLKTQGNGQPFAKGDFLECEAVELINDHVLIIGKAYIGDKVTEIGFFVLGKNSVVGLEQVLVNQRILDKRKV